MTETFHKLNLKDQSPILVLNAPESFAREAAGLKGEAEVDVRPAKGAAYSFALAFGVTSADLAKAARAVVPILDGDAVCWFAYPKGTSKKLRSDINRDGLWELLKPLGLTPVRQVAIDADWSALRFRLTKFVKK
jgi:hypothetical protein